MLYIYIYLYFLEDFTCGVAKQRSKAGSGVIVGGTGSKKGYFPWQAAIYNGKEFMCGGALISKTHILTAAHCFRGRSKDVNQYTVVLGEHNRKYNEGKNYDINLLCI